MITLHAYKDQVVGVFGLGKAGIATIKALAAGGAKVVAWDDRPESRDAAEVLGLDVQLRKIEKWPWDYISIVVIGPGIPLYSPEPHPVVLDARQHFCPIVGDIELLYQAQPHATYIAITGTNGKSTTTALTGHMLKHAGKQVEVGGNIGIAALSLEPLGANGAYVLELSSYQLDLLATTRFDIALILNLSLDHIERHGSIDGYIAAKAHIFDRQTPHDHAVIAVDDAYMRGMHEDLIHNDAAITTVTTTGEKADISVVDGVIIDGQTRIDLTTIRSLQGRHNWQNAVSAYTIAKLLHIPTETIKEGLESFPGLVHRMEWIDEIGGVTFINDSKATNANATSHALNAFDHIYWIAGGVAKEGGINTLKPYFPKIKRAYLIGEAEDAFSETLGGEVMHSNCNTLERAVEKACQDAQIEGMDRAVVLLSPACASFDQYASFEARGEHFKMLVEQLKHQQ